MKVKKLELCEMASASDMGPFDSFMVDKNSLFDFVLQKIDTKKFVNSVTISSGFGALIDEEELSADLVLNAFKIAIDNLYYYETLLICSYGVAQNFMMRNSIASSGEMIELEEEEKFATEINQGVKDATYEYFKDAIGEKEYTKEEIYKLTDIEYIDQFIFEVISPVLDEYENIQFNTRMEELKKEYGEDE